MGLKMRHLTLGPAAESCTHPGRGHVGLRGGGAAGYENCISDTCTTAQARFVDDTYGIGCFGYIGRDVTFVARVENRDKNNNSWIIFDLLGNAPHAWTRTPLPRAPRHQNNLALSAPVPLGLSTIGEPPGQGYYQRAKKDAELISASSIGRIHCLKR